jgi:TolB-like protein/lipoprotein NlpI
VIQSSKGVFLSYASEDAGVAKRICDALRIANVEVWFDQSELRGGDAWDQKIRQQIRDCALFVPIISSHTQERSEGYFRLEWKLAVDRSHLMAAEKAFLVPVVVDGTTEPEALVPAQFREVQWTRLQADEVPAAFVDRIETLLHQPVAHHEGSPEGGLHRTSARRLRVALLALPVAAVVGLVIAMAMRGGWFGHKLLSKEEAGTGSTSVATTPTAIPEKSIAVLPFVDMSEKQDEGYFSDGLSEELIDMLTRVPDLKVPARTSSFYFKGKQATVRDIAAALGVAHVLEGSVRRSGKTLRITAQLVRTDNGYHLWSETYDRKIDDIFKIQDEIAGAVVKALQVSLLRGTMHKAIHTPNVEAHSLYLQARALHDYATTEEAYDKVNVYLGKALAIDPAYALVWAFRSELYFEDSGDMAKARQAAEKALELDPQLPEAHAALAKILFQVDWDWSGAEEQARLALALDPNSPSAQEWAGTLAFWMGRHEQGLEFQKKSVDLDPVNPVPRMRYAWALFHAGRLDAALAEAHKVHDQQPNNGQPNELAGQVLLIQGAPAKALAEFNRTTFKPIQVWGQALAYHALGQKAASDAAVAELQRMGAGSEVILAGIHAFRGENDPAFAALDQAVQKRDNWVVWVKDDPLFGNIKADPRWKIFLRKMKAPE